MNSLCHHPQLTASDGKLNNRIIGQSSAHNIKFLQKVDYRQCLITTFTAQKEKPSVTINRHLACAIPQRRHPQIFIFVISKGNPFKNTEKAQLMGCL